MKGIYKRPDSNKYWISYVDASGRIVRESSGSDKYRDAAGLLHKQKQAVLEGKHICVRRPKNHDFSELAERYMTWVKGRQKSEKVKGYIIGQLLKKYGNLPLIRFNTALVEQLQTDNINRGTKPSYNNKVLNIMKHMFTKAHDWEMVGDDILQRVRKVKLLREDSGRLRYLSTEEAQSLIDACDEHLRPIVITALNTGMRKGEILGLRWDDNVDLRNGLLLLGKTKNGDRREIPISDTLRATLQDVLRRIDVPYVFYAPKTGKRYGDIKNSYKTALRRAGIKDFRFHDLRHTFASQLVMAGVDLTTIKEFLGHKSLKMTLRYAHLAPEHKRKAIQVLDETLQSSTSRLLHVPTKKGVGRGV